MADDDKPVISKKMALKKTGENRIAKFRRLASDYTKKSVAYNVDCNLRLLPRGKEDAKRAKLRKASDRAFRVMMAHAESVLQPLTTRQAKVPRP